MRLSDSEWTVMQAVWGRPSGAGPATARDVHSAVSEETNWTYSTVRSLLSRLVEKGALAGAKRANQTEYEPQVSQDVAQRSALRSLLDRAFGGRVDALAQHLADEKSLSAKDRKELQRLLDEERRR